MELLQVNPYPSPQESVYPRILYLAPCFTEWKLDDAEWGFIMHCNCIEERFLVVTVAKGKHCKPNIFLDEASEFLSLLIKFS